MNPRILFCAVLVSVSLAAGLQLHAQSTGLFVNSSNNVGIGTTSPQTELDVQGNGSDSQDLLRITRGNGNLSRVQIGHCYIQRYDGTGVPNALYINANGGNVGIGTTSPGYLLDVNGVIHSTVGGGSNIVLSKPLGSSIAFDNNAGVQTALIESGSPASGSNRLEFWTNTSANTGLVERMRIDNYGNVGIGTTTPGYKLDVSGQVHATSFVSATQTYADFVFKPGYKLAPLSDVEASIKKDGHLPGIPSETEAKAHGIDLTQMQVKLLQKIEELTLHQIDQEKHQIEQDKQLSGEQNELKEQAQRIEQLEKENAELRKRLPNE